MDDSPSDTNKNPPTRRIIVGISGASGAIYAQRFIELLLSSNVEVHLVISPYGQRLLHDELAIDKWDAQTLSKAFFKPESKGKLITYNYRDVGAVIASGSFTHDGMIIIPCSSNTLGAVASGAGQNLMHRAAHVTLKERRKLVLVHREMPLSLIDIRNMQTVTEAGGVMAPANPGFYMNPTKIDDLVDFIAGRCLDLLNIHHDLPTRWQGG